MSLAQPQDLYCERLTPALLAEPANALSNLAFLIAALWLWPRSRPAAILLATIGVGSLLFHTLANTGSMVADVLPISVFVLGLAWRAFGPVLDWPWTRVLGLALLCSLPMMLLWAVVPDPAAAGLAYLPGILGLPIVATLLHRRGHPGARQLTDAAALMLAAWSLRALDGPSCEALPIGTHFLWHLLAAPGLALAAAALTQEAPHAPDVPAP